MRRVLILLPSATKFMFLHVSVILFTGGGYYPSMHCRWYRSMPCSGGVCSQGCLLPGGWGCLLWGVCSGGCVCLLGGVCSQGVCSRGVPAPGVGGACSRALLLGVENPPGSRRLLLRTVRILLKCILV